MSALRLVFDNDADLLAQRLARLIAGDEHGGGNDPFADDVLIVSGLGVGRWLQQRITDELGVACVLPIEMATSFLWRLIAELLDRVPSQPPFDPLVLRWIIYAQLSALADDPGIEPKQLAPLHARLRGAGSHERLMLARSIAVCLNDLLAFRRNWLAAWARGELSNLGTAAGVGGEAGRQAGDQGGRQAGDPAGVLANERWLAWLWRGVLAQMPTLATRHPFDRFADWLRTTSPQRLTQAFADVGVRTISIFGTPPLAPEQIDLFGLIARFVPVTFLVTDPCREFWQDIVSEKAVAAIRATRPDVAWLYDSEPAVLGAWGKAHRDYLAQLRALEETLAGTTAVLVEESFRERPLTPPRGRLHALQQAILTRNDSPWDEVEVGSGSGSGSESGNEGDRGANDRGERLDYSLQIHSCHGAVRQIEVLRDRLLHAFDLMPDLQPDQVLVLAPDIDAFAPFIDGVFGVGQIPYSIQGQRISSDPVHGALSVLLLTAQRQPNYSALQTLLDNPAMAQALGIDDDERHRLLGWLDRAGFRSAQGKHGWQAALDRLWFGAAVAIDADQPPPVAGDKMAIAGAVPATMPGLGKLARLFASLERIADAARQPASLAHWCALLARECDHWFAAPRAGRASTLTESRLRIHDALAGLSEAQARALSYGATLEAGAESSALLIDLASFIGLFEEAAAPPSAQIRPGSGVTFAPIQALRGVPARLIALIGLSESDFPQSRGALDYDLIAQAPRFGDQLRGNNDRGAFLDALTQARDVLIMTYDGRDLRSNEPLNPSALIAECIAYIRRQPGQKQFAPIEQTLMSFSPQNFQRPDWPSYDRASYAAAAVLEQRPAREPNPRHDNAHAFIAADALLGSEQSDLRRLSLPSSLSLPLLPPPPLPAPIADGDEWVRVLARPAQAFLRRSLRMSLPDWVLLVDDHEPVDIHDDLRLNNKVRLQRTLEAGLSATHWTQLKGGRHADPQYPQGVAALLAGAQLDEKVRQMQADARKALGGRPISADLRTETVSWHGVALQTGAIDQAQRLDAERVMQFVWSAWKPGAHSAIDVWLRHAAAQLWAGERTVQTVWIHDGNTMMLDEHLTASALDQRLQALLAQTQAICTRALPLFPKTYLTAHQERLKTRKTASASRDKDGGGDRNSDGDGSGGGSGSGNSDGDGGGNGRSDPFDTDADTHNEAVRKSFLAELGDPWVTALYRDGPPDLEQVLRDSESVYGPLFAAFTGTGRNKRRG